MISTKTLGELCDAVGAELHGGDRSFEVSAIRALAEAGPTDLSFVHQASLMAAARTSAAAVLLVPRSLAVAAGELGKILLVVEQSQLALARLLAFFYPRVAPKPGIHATAVVGEGCQIDASAAIGPFVVIGEGSTLDAGVEVEAHTVIGRRCQIGAGSRLHAHVVLYDDVALGPGCEIHSGTVLGADGFGYASVAGVHHKIPQVGRVEIGREVEIGALTAIDRAALEATRVGDGTKIDNQVQVGHNVQIGKGCILCGQVGIAGSTTLGNYVVMAGSAGAAGHLQIGDQTTIAAASVVLQDLPAKRVVAGVPAVEIQDWKRQVAAQSRLAELLRRVRRLEKQLGKDESP